MTVRAVTATSRPPLLLPREASLEGVVYPAATSLVYRVATDRRIAYAIDASDPEAPWLTRDAGTGPVRLLPDIESLQFSYVMNDGSTVTDNLWGERWGKLCQNSMGNPVTAMSGLGSLDVMSSEVGRTIIFTLVCSLLLSLTAIPLAMGRLLQHTPPLRLGALERGVVVDGAVGGERPAVAVGGVLAQAGVGDQRQRQRRVVQDLQRALDDAVVDPGAAARRILRLGQAEEDHPAQVQLGVALGVAQRLVGRHPLYARQRGDRLTDSAARPDEDRRHEHSRMEARLADQRAQRRQMLMRTSCGSSWASASLAVVSSWFQADSACARRSSWLAVRAFS